MHFNDYGNLICGEEAPSLFGTFDLTTAPQLLYYSYIPIMVVSLIFGFFILSKDKRSLRSKIFFALTLSFVFWVLTTLMQWVASPHAVIMFAWQVNIFFEIGLYLSSLYFAYVFIHRQDVSFTWKLFFSVLILLTCVLVPTEYNIQYYDVANCEGALGMFWDIVYSLEPGTIFLIGYIGFKSYLKEKNVSNKKQTAILTSGMVFFLLTFFLSNFYGEITKVYEFNLWGPIGIFIFFILLVYMIVKFKTFDIKLLATQALVWALAILIGAQFFFIKVTVNFILNAFTFVAILFFGELLVESVKNEVKQREYLEQINLELQRLVKQRESLVHLVTHKVKGSFTRSKYLFSEMLDGTFGPLTPMLATMTKRGLESDIEGIATVDLVLNSANLQNGTVKYDMKPTDFKDIVEKLVAEKSKVAESRGLTMNMHSTQEPELHYTVLGDTFWLKEVVINLLENSIRYTRAGNIDVTLTEKDKKIVLCVKDTGVGITDEDKKNLFTEGGRGKDSVKINVDSTGYGLFSVKLIVEAHHGRIWAESAGADKGSAFYVEFDALA